MSPVDWQEAWKAGVTPWDAGASPPALRSLLDRGVVPAGRILVPGCGTGYDLATLARADREVVGIDLSEDARTAFLEAHPNLPGSVDYEVTDFFAYVPAQGFDFVWDYTFFCALDPDQRSSWSQTMERLVEPGGVLATLLFPFEDPISGREGPPWPINTDLVRGYVEDAFEALETAAVKHTHPGREGKERLALWRRREP
ncbi:MAG: methyltransferase domain-containing protein [Deltaproteobacteria bacterium]|nr:methyltransferase domain-containing protein [Deltaproteobacteria bacterium]MBW2378413.1 methyltransferase domain-containing protein [Deltaproteobacteria bacterium]MBW2549914.1 methyltransferase domain-containing protein [Deltaproteobacteria bacterium]